MMTKFLTDNVRWIAGVLLLGVIIAVIFALGRCSGGDESAQVQQTTRSTNAVASAAADAVSTLEERTSDEKSIDEAVTQATQEIRNAQTVEKVHSAVTQALCGKPAYANDPACVGVR